MAYVTHEVSCYLRDGSPWVGYFNVDDGDLNFGDDRFDSAHGLVKLAYAEPTRSTNDADARVRVWMQSADQTVEAEGAQVVNPNGVIEQMKLAA